MREIIQWKELAAKENESKGRSSNDPSLGKARPLAGKRQLRARA